MGVNVERDFSYNVFVVLIAFAVLISISAITYARFNQGFSEKQVPQGSTFLNAAGFPRGSKLVLNAFYTVKNDEDSGNVGYWALDNYIKTVQVWKAPMNDTYYVMTKYVGSWNTFDGALSPGSGLNETKDARGLMFGGYTGSFTASGVTCKNGNLGTYDFGGTKADILLGKYADGQKGDSSSFSYLSNCFSNYSNFKYTNWGWVYNYRGQRWINSQSSTTGDVVV